MTPEFIAERKADLIKKKAEIEEQLKTFATKKEDGEWETNFPQMNESEEDKVDEVEEYENMLPVELVLRADLEDVDIALDKIEKGIYGKCENCGCDCDIPEERLIALPETPVCNNCEECHCDECDGEGEEKGGETEV